MPAILVESFLCGHATLYLCDLLGFSFGILSLWITDKVINLQALFNDRSIYGWFTQRVEVVETQAADPCLQSFF